MSARSPHVDRTGFTLQRAAIYAPHVGLTIWRNSARTPPACPCVVCTSYVHTMHVLRTYYARNANEKILSRYRTGGLRAYYVRSSELRTYYVRNRCVLRADYFCR